MNSQTLIRVEPINDVSVEGLDYFNSGDEYLTFCVGQENYGVDILTVKEIRGWEEPTLIPNSPEYVRGVINIRGTIIPIIDLRVRFDLGVVEYTPTTVVVVISVDKPNLKRMMGFVVDAVSDVLVANDSELTKCPDFGGKVPSVMINGLVNKDDEVVTILLPEQMLCLEV